MGKNILKIVIVNLINNILDNNNHKFHIQGPFIMGIIKDKRKKERKR